MAHLLLNIEGRSIKVLSEVQLACSFHSPWSYHCTFLPVFIQHKPSKGHVKAALHALHYKHSTHDYEISFTSDDMGSMHSYIHYLPSINIEAYWDATPPMTVNTSTFHPTAMLAGVRRLEGRLLRVLFFLCFNSVVWLAVLSSDMVVPSVGWASTKSVHPLFMGGWNSSHWCNL